MGQRCDRSGSLVVSHLRERRLIPCHTAAAGRSPDHDCSHDGGEGSDRG
jgi:hypothetical protein